MTASSPPSPPAAVPTAGRGPRITIVGAGASGLLVARALLADGPPADVTLVERRGEPGAGLAYGTHEPAHRLNVPAAKMSALPDVPDDFLAFARGRGVDAGPDAFLERRLYAAYLADVLARAETGTRARGGATVARVADEVVDVLADERGAGGAPLAVALASGRSIAADRVVLALGNPAPVDPPALANARLPAPLYVRDPWARGALDGLAPSAPIALVGTGLTAVDVVLSLRARGHAGPIVAISRRGLLPRAHREGPAPRAPDGAIDVGSMEGSVRAAIRVIRRDAARRRALGGDARETIAELRPHTQRLWRALPTAERRRFLARVRPFWDVHRHRMPPEVAREIGALRAAGTLSVFAGTLSLARAEDDRVALAWRRRGTAIDERGLFARVVNATGPSPDLRASTSPLVVALRGRGWLVPDPLGLGISTEDDGALVTADPRARGRLFTLGPPRLGDLWETTAIPEVRVQAIALASRLRRVDA